MSRDDRANPWTTLRSRSVYENPWIAVREDEVTRPDGSPGIYGVIHFKPKAIGVLPVDEQGGVWLVGQYRYPLGRYSWEIPEGGCFEKESPEDAACRELKEETGLIAGRLERIGESHLSNAVTDELGIIFRATELEQGTSEPESCERLEVRRVEWSEAWRLLRAGEITDSISVIALLYEAVRRGQRL
jgi:8-oxo-dGTP pyrophosphatase MutT (NUDIX family)